MITDEFMATFCEQGPDARKHLARPFRRAGFIWATDGRALLRIPDDGRANIEEQAAPRMEEVFPAHLEKPGWPRYLIADILGDADASSESPFYCTPCCGFGAWDEREISEDSRRAQSDELLVEDGAVIRFKANTEYQGDRLGNLLESVTIEIFHAKGEHKCKKCGGTGLLKWEAVVLEAGEQDVVGWRKVAYERAALARFAAIPGAIVVPNWKENPCPSLVIFEGGTGCVMSCRIPGNGVIHSKALPLTQEVTK